MEAIAREFTDRFKLLVDIAFELSRNPVLAVLGIALYEVVRDRMRAWSADAKGPSTAGGSR